MANLGTEFDASQVEPAAPREPVPPGEYVMQIKNSEMKTTKSGEGQYLQLDLEITEGDYKGRMVFDRLNLVNPSTTAEEIAHRTLSAICHAVGVLKVRDSSQLHYKRMLVRVDVEKRDGHAAQNAVKSYKAMEGASPVAGSSAATDTATVKKPSWQK